MTRGEMTWFCPDIHEMRCIQFVVWKSCYHIDFIHINSSVNLEQFHVNTMLLLVR